MKDTNIVLDGDTDIDSISILDKDERSVIIFQSNTNDYPLSPIFSFYCTLIMNILTPSSFSSLYYAFTIDKLSMIHSNAFYGQYDSATSMHRTLRHIPSTLIDLLTLSGFRIQESPCFESDDHSLRCYNSRCRLHRNARDDHVLHVPFGPVLHPFRKQLPKVVWSL